MGCIVNGAHDACVLKRCLFTFDSDLWYKVAWPHLTPWPSTPKATRYFYSFFHRRRRLEYIFTESAKLHLIPTCWAILAEVMSRLGSVCGFKLRRSCQYSYSSSVTDYIYLIIGDDRKLNIRIPIIQVDLKRHLSQIRLYLICVRFAVHHTALSP